MTLSVPRWGEHTREERYFTAILFQVLREHAEPFWAELRHQLRVPADVDVVDIGYEVCMLRDLAHASKIVRGPFVKAWEKQTFDLVLTLSNHELVLIEAKAHERFSTRQIHNMQRTGKLLVDTENLGIRRVHIAGLHSSRYRPDHVRAQFPAMALTTWLQLAVAYPSAHLEFTRADEIFDDRRRIAGQAIANHIPLDA